MDEEDQKGKVAWCCERDTESTSKQFYILYALNIDIDLDTWGTAYVFEKRHYYVKKWLKNLTNDLNILEMTYICGKCLRNG